MTLFPDYLADVTREMAAKSNAIRRDFATHRLSGGENREHLVTDFLSSHLPGRFGVSSGLIVSPIGQFSNQADVVVVDGQNNSPLYGASRVRLWPVESVYALIEVKTTLSPAELTDSVSKCQRFKKLERRFCETSDLKLKESLFVVWAFECPAIDTIRQNILSALDDIPREHQPDLFIVPGRIAARSGSYFELSRLGQIGSPYRIDLLAKHGNELTSLIPGLAEVDEFGDSALLAWYVWFDSWLRRAGTRMNVPLAYLPEVITSTQSA
ncbi:DUF6602 domain-containing protein [Nitrosomonas ureae]|uniref:DUF6602 domain-containing protein n=1 Tax=Nitrosomonas ureae TaxID=44577 RepID=A0A286A5R4_9PROT|nr:DUF6602 domain-containing protein [Nitrosomonas ureae]SOD17256.1 hypothetical protein SAMN06297164_1091 [Nitrosomonas ureae]